VPKVCPWWLRCALGEYEVAEVAEVCLRWQSHVQVDTRRLRCALGGNKVTEVYTRSMRYDLGEFQVAEMSQRFLRYAQLD
jgi:hypothetical protein